jgi:hypothetical protein
VEGRLLRRAYAQQLGLSGSRGAASLRRPQQPLPAVSAGLQHVHDARGKPKPAPKQPNRNSSDCVCSVQVPQMTYDEPFRSQFLNAMMKHDGLP